MAAINRALLLQEVNFYLGGSNLLPDLIITSLGESIISKVGDDTIYHKEIVCKTLEKAAIQNQVMSTTDGGRGVKRERSDGRDVEFFKSDPVSYWQDFLDQLPKLCSSFGYCDLPSKYSGRFKANVSTAIRHPSGSQEVGAQENNSLPSGQPIVSPIYDE